MFVLPEDGILFATLSKMKEVLLLVAMLQKTRKLNSSLVNLSRGGRSIRFFYTSCWWAKLNGIS